MCRAHRAVVRVRARDRRRRVRVRERSHLPLGFRLRIGRAVPPARRGRHRRRRRRHRRWRLRAKRAVRHRRRGLRPRGQGPRPAGRRHRRSHHRAERSVLVRDEAARGRALQRHRQLAARRAVADVHRRERRWRGCRRRTRRRCHVRDGVVRRRRYRDRNGRYGARPHEQRDRRPHGQRDRCVRLHERRSRAARLTTSR